MSLLAQALNQLDKNNDDHWTSDGQPRLDVLKLLLNRNVTRADIAATQKGFSRTSAGADDDDETITENDIITDVVEAATDLGESSLEEKEKTICEKIEVAERELADAKRELDSLREELDVVIGERELLHGKTSQADTIKAFQASQLEQRRKAADHKKQMNDALSNMSKNLV